MIVRYWWLTAVAIGAAAGGAKAQAAPPPRLEFSGDVGFVSVSGNKDVTTFNVGEKVLRRFDRWELRQSFSLVYGETDGEETSNLWRADLRGDYGIGGRLALYALTVFDRNRFAGIKARFHEGIGVALKAVATARDQVSLEGGVGLTQQQSLTEESANFTAVRLAATAKHGFSDAAYVFQGLEFLPNVEDSDDWLFNSETALVAPLSTHVAMKFSFLVKYDNLPELATDGTTRLRKLDRILSAGVQVSF